MQERNTKVLGGSRRIQTKLWEKLGEILNSTGQREELKIELVPDPLDQVISSAERELAVARLQGYTNLVNDIRSALQKIQDGTYGCCEECEESIAAKRLDAIPWARYCVRCQQQLESRLSDGGEIGDETGSLIQPPSMPLIERHSASRQPHSLLGL